MWWYIFAAIVCIFIYLIVTYHLEKYEIENVKQKSVFITGCDSGFGHLLALKLVENGATAFAGCLTEAGEVELKKKAASFPGSLITLRLDVTKEDSVQKALDFVTEKCKQTGLWAVVCNAGIAGETGPDDFLTLEDYKQVLDVNTYGIIRVAQAFKPMLKRSKGRLVIMTSIVASVAAPTAGPYSVSKYAAEAYADVLRRELSVFGVTVHIIKPGFFKTAITNPNNFIDPLKKKWDQLPEALKAEYGGVNYLNKRIAYTNRTLGAFMNPKVDQVVGAYYHAITSKRPRNRYFVGIDAQTLFRFVALIPDTFQDLILGTIQLMCGDPKPTGINKA